MSDRVGVVDVFWGSRRSIGVCNGVRGWPLKLAVIGVSLAGAFTSWLLLVWAWDA